MPSSPLVDTHPSFNAVIVPEDSDDLPQTIQSLETLLGQTGIKAKLDAADDEGRPEYEPVTVEERLEWPQVVALETHQLDLPGVSLEITPARHYLYGSLAAHLLGYVGEVDREDLMKASYKSGDEIGKFGLERGWEPFLRGEAGGQEIEVDSVGRRLRVLKEIPDHPGQSIVLTLDLDVQQAAEQAMQGKMGAIVALDPNNGNIISMVSNPSFDPDIFGGGVKAVDWHKLMTDPDHPLQNRVIQGAYPPGSTFKIVDSIAGMEEKTLTPETTYECNGGLWFGGRTYHCWRKHGHGAIQLHRAIVSSCDVFFYQVGEKLGIDKLSHWAHLMGLGERSGIALDNEKGGTIRLERVEAKRFHERWYPAETLSVAIGQGYVAATPMQMAQVAAEVANGGIRYRPQFVKEVEGLDGSADEDLRADRRRSHAHSIPRSSLEIAQRDVRRGQRLRRHRAKRRSSKASRWRAKPAPRRSSARKRQDLEPRKKTTFPTSIATTDGSSRSRRKTIRKSRSPASSSTAAMAAAPPPRSSMM